MLEHSLNQQRLLVEAALDPDCWHNISIMACAGRVAGYVRCYTEGFFSLGFSFPV